VNRVTTQKTPFFRTGKEHGKGEERGQNPKVYFTNGDTSWLSLSAKEKIHRNCNNKKKKLIEEVEENILTQGRRCSGSRETKNTSSQFKTSPFYSTKDV
jgi:hypothetical protein